MKTPKKQQPIPKQLCLPLIDRDLQPMEDALITIYVDEQSKTLAYDLPLGLEGKDFDRFKQYHFIAIAQYRKDLKQIKALDTAYARKYINNLKAFAKDMSIEDPFATKLVKASINTKDISIHNFL